MQEQESEYSSVHDADMHVCLFPHLNEFIILDARDPDHPKTRVVSAGELLTPAYYDEVEAEFSAMLRSGDAPFMNLMTLPQRLEMFLRRRGMEGLVDILTDGSESDDPRISVFICAGGILTMKDPEISQALEAFFENGPSPSFVAEYGETFRRLLGEERASVQKRQVDELRRAVQGQSNQFYTLWQDQQGPGSN